MKDTFVLAVFDEWCKLFMHNEICLTELDSVGGDGDIGYVMKDGFTAMKEYVLTAETKDFGKLFFDAGIHFNRVAPSSMGTLLASGLINVGKNFRGKEEFNYEDIVDVLSLMTEGIKSKGNSNVGEKTILDSIVPAINVLTVEPTLSKTILEKAVLAAEVGVNEAKMMEAKHGRLAFREDKSVGIIDPGSVVGYLIVKGVYTAYVKTKGE